MKRWKIKHLDVKTKFSWEYSRNFFHVVAKRIYTTYKKQKVCLLLKAFHGFKQTSRLGTSKLTISFPLLVNLIAN